MQANAIMVGGSVLANIGALLYHLLMGRLLGPVEYGVLQSLISLSNILNVPMMTVNTVIVKFVSGYVGREEFGKISYVFHRLQKLFWILLFIGGGLFLLVKKPLLAFLHIDSAVSFLLFDFALFFGLLQILNRSVLQGLAKFIQYTIVHFIEAYGKLILGIIAVYAGWKATGAFGAFVFAGILGYVYTYVVLKNYLPSEEAKVKLKWKEYLQFSIPSFLVTVSITSFFNIDVVLVRHFLSPYEAGIYSSLALLGKIIYFGAVPVLNTMYPLIGQAHSRGTGYHRIFLLSLLLMVGITGTITLVYSLFPERIISFMVSSQYREASTHLTLYSIFISFVALVNLMALLYLSMQKTFPIICITIAGIVQAVLIVLFHGSLGNVISVSIWVLASLLAVLLLYYVYVAKDKIIFGYRAFIQAGKNNRT